MMMIVMVVLVGVAAVSAQLDRRRSVQSVFCSYAPLSSRGCWALLSAS